MNLRKLSPAVVALCVLSVAPVSYGQMTPPPPPMQGPAQAPARLIVRLIEVQYAGASTISKEEILANMRARFGRPYFEQIEDVAAIRELYQSKGYIDVVVAPRRIDRIDGQTDITFVISEGPIYHVGKVAYNGAKVLTFDEVSKKAKIQPGGVYSPQGVRADVKRLQDLYGSRGYVDFQAAGNSIPGPDRTFDVTFNLDEGVQTYLEHITGNMRTQDKVRVEASKQRLMNLNYFAHMETYP
jgi:outer membrane translocation and assembly module TamA